MQKTKLEVW